LKTVHGFLFLRGRNKIVIELNPKYGKVAAFVKTELSYFVITSWADTGNVELRITDAVGRIVLAQQQQVAAGVNQLILPGLSRLAKGTYIVEAINLDDSRREVYKLTKE